MQGILSTYKIRMIGSQLKDGTAWISNISKGDGPGDERWVIDTDDQETYHVHQCSRPTWGRYMILK